MVRLGSGRRRRPVAISHASRASLDYSSSVAEQHVEHVIALLADGLGASRSGEGRVLSRRDAIPIDDPGTRLGAGGNQVLRLGGRGGPAIHDVAAGEAWRAAPFASAVADAMHNANRTSWRL